MRKTIYLTPNGRREGIDITYIKSSQKLSIGGWFDSIVGIQSTPIELFRFFEQLGITEKDCKKAFEKLDMWKRAEISGEMSKL